jgi:hypothetical protein
VKRLPPTPVAELVAGVLAELDRRRDHERRGLLTLKQAADYLALSPRSLQDRADVPRVDIRDPASDRACWRYRREDLDTFAARRVVNPFSAEPAA